MKPSLTNIDSGWLVELVADCLDLSADEIARQAPLVRLGLDSLKAVQLTMEIASRLPCDVPETLLLSHPTIESLEAFTRKAFANEQLDSTMETGSRLELAQMESDSTLPPGIFPQAGLRVTGPARSILLTGATGFLGAYLLRALLRDTTARIYCLVRPNGTAPLERVRSNLAHYGIWNADDESRLHAIEGDLQLPELGGSSEAYDFLTRTVDEIYHCGAAVNWVLPYAALREVNVLGTRQLLRLACNGQPKPFHFISSMSTCYSMTRQEEVTEQDDMQPHLDSIHLGYAQSKCVAESLVRQASDRGLPATIHRPSLVTGDSQTGFSNEDDLLSVMIQGCIRMGSAPDLNWVLDCCPVDFAADAIVGLSSQAGQSLRVFHLANPDRRHWREVALWMRLFGYPIRLDSNRDWLAQLRTEATTPDHPLYSLRSFFFAKPAADSELTLPQMYEVHRHSRVRHSQTLEQLSQLPLACPRLDADLLDRYFDSFIQRGILPGVANQPKGGAREHDHLDRNFFQHVLRCHYKDNSIGVERIVKLDSHSQESITTELTSWQSGNKAGLWKYRADLTGQSKNIPGSLELFVKVKPQDKEVMTVSEKVAAMCDASVGQSFANHRHRLGIAGSHRREVHIYRQTDDRFRDHVPQVYSAIENDEQREWILVLESLSGLELLDSASDGRRWRREYVEAAIEGIAQIHSIWYQREHELASQRWLGPIRTSRDMSGMTDLWESLADYAWNHFENWIGPDTRPVIDNLISGVGTWSQSLEQLPQTLIHNDFNPRNIAFRNRSGKLRLCAYDWELATSGVPQHDLAELLCFVLPPNFSQDLMLHYLEMHRACLSAHSGCAIDPAVWRTGFQLALNDLIVNRFSMYCLMQPFRPQPFLPNVVKTWRRMHDLFPLKLTPGAQQPANAS